MKITESTVTKLIITELERLDPISIFLEDLQPGQGKLTVECYGQSWSSSWGAMSDRNISEFLLSCNNDYIIGKISTVNRMIVDYDEISKQIGHEVNEHSLMLSEKEMFEMYGDDWRCFLPRMDNCQWDYLNRIVNAIKEAIAERATSKD